MIKSLNHILQNKKIEKECVQSIDEIKNINSQEQEEPKILDCMDYMGAFKLKKKFFDSEVEKKYMMCFAHLSIKNILLFRI